MTASTVGTLRGLLAAAGSPYVETAWDRRIDNPCIDDVIDRFDDCPEALQDFHRSDWVNLAEPYTADLLRRWEQQTDGIRALWDGWCDAIGATSTAHALEGELDSIEDGDDLNALIVNRAMTWAAIELCNAIYPDL